jgi:soluble lytic murein transglycosylase-like protein
MNHFIVLQVALAVFTADPYNLHKPTNFKQVKNIVDYADTHRLDPYELLAIAITESRLNPKAVSSAGAVGIMQVMCKFWYKSEGYKSIQQCDKALLNPKINIAAGARILTTYRSKYKQCAGDLAYRCYFAGQGWKRHKGRVAKQIIRYENKVKQIRKMLPLHYSDLIEETRIHLLRRG